MSDIDTLERIKRKESEADSALSRAEQEYHKEIDAAKIEAGKILDKARIRSDAEYKRIILDYQRETLAKVDELERESDETIGRIKRLQKRSLMSAFERAVRNVLGV
jgi:vacuolar-type H+-ATPase subunit H